MDKLAPWILWAAQGCSSCPAISAPPQYVITVTDSTTKVDICDAEVTVDAQPTVPPAHCRHIVNIPEDRNEVTLVVTHPGYQPTTRTVSTRYSTDDCGHARPVTLRLELDPS